MIIEIVDFPIKNGDFPLLCKRSPEGNAHHAIVATFFVAHVLIAAN